MHWSKPISAIRNDIGLLNAVGSQSTLAHAHYACNELADTVAKPTVVSPSTDM